MLTTLKNNFLSSRIYLKTVILLFIAASILLLIFSDDQSLNVILISVFLLFNLLLINALGEIRRKELTQVREVIRKISSDEIINEKDITLNKQLEPLQKEIQMMFEKTRMNIEYLKKLEKMRTQFIANTSHELRTPVFAIHGYLETLLDGALEDQKVNRTFLEKANNHTISLNLLLNDLIDISMIESGEMRMHFRYFPVNDFILPIIEEFKPNAEAKGLELNFIPAAKNLSLFGDKDKIRQVFVNLIQNAIKYTESGKVEVIIEDEPKCGKIIIRDTGIGIPADEINRIFERFYRVDKARSKEVGGTGLGLAIVKHIIEAHNSAIEVKSILNEGSEFSFKLKK